MTQIVDNIKRISQNIQTVAIKNHRNPAEITLIAVSKTKPSQCIVEAFEAGQRDFGENYLQEAQLKMAELANLPIIWHFLGPIQSNKTLQIAQQFDWVHSIERFKTAQRLSRQRAPTSSPLNICLQVNIDQEPSKAGCSEMDAVNLAKQISTLPNLRLRGLMAVPKPQSGKRPFTQLAQLLKQINQDCGLNMEVLSMGMSADMDDAIVEGATHVRIGTAIFGARQP